MEGKWKMALRREGYQVEGDGGRGGGGGRVGEVGGGGGGGVVWCELRGEDISVSFPHSQSASASASISA